jgi:Rieske 2Fe-2S family protein
MRRGPDPAALHPDDAGADPVEAILGELDREITSGLTEIEATYGPSYTGGSLKWMGVCAKSAAQDGYVDYGHVIARFSRDEFVRFVSLADDPDVFDPELQHQYVFGDETEHPLNKRQMLFLKCRYGVYFPWKLAYHLVTNFDWEDKNSGAGKSFSPEAERVFPKTVAFIRSLPFQEIGRCLIFGLEANDHAPLHRDTEPRSKDTVDHCLSICPRGDKRLYLSDPDEQVKLVVKSRVYWFNDMDYHGVLPDPYFRYSIRIDGVFEPWFVEAARRLA